MLCKKLNMKIQFFNLHISLVVVFPKYYTLGLSISVKDDKKTFFIT